MKQINVLQVNALSTLDEHRLHLNILQHETCLVLFILLLLPKFICATLCFYKITPKASNSLFNLQQYH